MPLPDTVEVSSPGLDPWFHPKDQYPVPMITKLFRQDAKLDTVLDLGIESYKMRSADKPFHVMSVGCSFGAEADSALAYLTQEAPELGLVKLTGIDINPKAVRAAQQGKYVTPAWMFSCARKALETYGFILGNEEGWGNYIDAARLRSQHAVTFVQADMRKKPLNAAIEAADVVLCNNVLYHLTPDDASSLVENAASHLADGGVMSWEYNSGVLLDMGDEKTNYKDWRIEMSEKLAASGILPIAFNNNGAPHIFRSET